MVDSGEMKMKVRAFFRVWSEDRNWSREGSMDATPVQGRELALELATMFKKYDKGTPPPGDVEQEGAVEANALTALTVTCPDCWAEVMGHCPKCGKACAAPTCIGLHKAHVDRNCPACVSPKETKKDG